MSTIRRHLPIPVLPVRVLVLYEMIPTYSEHHKDYEYEKLIITITFGNWNPGADVLFPAHTVLYGTMCKRVNRGLLLPLPSPPLPSPSPPLLPSTNGSYGTGTSTYYLLRSAWKGPPEGVDMYSTVRVQYRTVLVGAPRGKTF